MAYLADDLLTDVRRSGMFPSSSAGATADADLLAYADKEMQTRLIPLLVSMREEWYSKVVDIPLVSGQAEYRLPKNAITGRTRLIQLLDPATNALTNLERIEPGRTQELIGNQQGRPWAYFLRGAAVALFPPPADSTLKIRVTYLCRPGSLQLSSNCKAVATASLSGGTWSLTTSGDLSTAADCVAATPPFEALADGTVVRTGSATYTCASGGVPSYGIAVGDWLCPANTSPVVQLPVELHGILTQRTVARAKLAQGYQQEAAQLTADADKLLDEAMRLLTPRTEGEQRKIVGQLLWRNRRGFLGRGW